PACNPDTADIESKVSALLAKMTLAEKIGQMVMGDILVPNYTVPNSQPAPNLPDVSSLFLGGVVASGNDGNTNKPSDWLNVTNQYRSAAAGTRLGIPVIFGVDAVHGNAKAAGATVFPQSIALGATKDTALVQQIAAATAAEVSAMGFTMAFAPDADVGQDERWGRTYESFGEDPGLVSPLVDASMKGLQNGCWASGAPLLLGSVKHAIGAGGTNFGTGTQTSQTGFAGVDRGDVTLDEATIRAVHLPPFKAAINAGAMTVLVSYSTINGTPMINNSHWLTDILKTELGFRGFTLSDYDGVPPSAPAADVAKAVNAGLDMMMLSHGASSLIATLKGAVPGMIPQSRIDDAVTRILRAKYVAGLFDQPAPTSAGLSVVGSADHLQLARKAVQESMVLLQNNNKRLPLSKSAHVVVAGLAGNDLGIQAGGWTISWQGAEGGSGVLGTTILQAMQNAATSSSLVTYSADGTGGKGADVGVVVLHENPYAEYCGDVTDPNFSSPAVTRPMFSPCGAVYDGTAATVVSNMKSAGIPLVLVLLSGRPMRVESYLSSFDAVVEAWLPGSAGEGVADLLYGNASFSGVLPKSWPRDSTTLPISSLQSGANPLFAFGFGLKQ
ncbi:MAG: glycoside hydrolase family 3 protein, partial [Myxococcales bacterium]|nr:glycoside hydrolase family 3 protein [Myxococcales bacterium]